MLKKLLCLLLCILTVVSLAACKDGENDADEAENNENNEDSGDSEDEKNSNGTPNPSVPKVALYIKDGELYCDTFKKDVSAIQLTESMNLDSEEGYSSYLFKEDKSAILYLNPINGVNTLCLRDLTAADSVSVTVGDDVKAFKTNADFSEIAYTKGENDEMYIFSVADKSAEKAAENVTDFAFVGGSAFYIADGVLYENATGTAKELGSNITKINEVFESTKTVYFTEEVGKDDDGHSEREHITRKLYKYTVGSVSTLISENYSEIIKIYESGEIYYTIPGDLDNVDLNNHVYSEYISELDKYDQSDVEFFHEKVKFSFFKTTSGEMYIDSRFTYGIVSLCFYDGAEEKELVDYLHSSMFDFTCIALDTADTPCLALLTPSPEKRFGKVNLYEVTRMATEQWENGDSYAFMMEYFAQQLCETAEQYLTVVYGDKLVRSDVSCRYKDGFKYKGDADQDSAYVKNIADEQASVYKIIVKNGKPEEACKVVEALPAEADYTVLPTGDVAYVANGDLYINNEKIDTEVEPFVNCMHTSDGEIFYIKGGKLFVYDGTVTETEFATSSGCVIKDLYYDMDSMALYSYESGKLTMIANEVPDIMNGNNQIARRSNGSLLFISDGKLCCYFNGMSNIVAADVTWFDYK